MNGLSFFGMGFQKSRTLIEKSSCLVGLTLLVRCPHSRGGGWGGEVNSTQPGIKGERRLGGRGPPPRHEEHFTRQALGSQLLPGQREGQWNQTESGLWMHVCWRQAPPPPETAGGEGAASWGTREGQELHLQTHWPIKRRDVCGQGWWQILLSPEVWSLRRADSHSHKENKAYICDTFFQLVKKVGMRKPTCAASHAKRKAFCWKAGVQNLREGWGQSGPLQSLRDSLPQLGLVRWKTEWLTGLWLFCEHGPTPLWVCWASPSAAGPTEGRKGPQKAHRGFNFF